MDSAGFAVYHDDAPVEDAGMLSLDGNINISEGPQWHCVLMVMSRFLNLK
jgi:hypothetical protein